MYNIIVNTIGITRAYGFICKNLSQFFFINTYEPITLNKTG